MAVRALKYLCKHLGATTVLRIPPQRRYIKFPETKLTFSVRYGCIECYQC